MVLQVTYTIISTIALFRIVLASWNFDEELPDELLMGWNTAKITVMEDVQTSFHCCGFHAWNDTQGLECPFAGNVTIGCYYLLSDYFTLKLTITLIVSLISLIETAIGPTLAIFQMISLPSRNRILKRMRVEAKEFNQDIRSRLREREEFEHL